MRETKHGYTLLKKIEQTKMDEIILKILNKYPKIRKDILATEATEAFLEWKYR